LFISPENEAQVSGFQGVKSKTKGFFGRFGSIVGHYSASSPSGVVTSNQEPTK